MRAKGGVIMNFSSLVLNDHRSKKIYRPQMIVDVDMSGAIFISDDLVFTENADLGKVFEHHVKLA